MQCRLSDKDISLRMWWNLKVYLSTLSGFLVTAAMTLAIRLWQLCCSVAARPRQSHAALWRPARTRKMKIGQKKLMGKMKIGQKKLMGKMKIAIVLPCWQLKLNDGSLLAV